MGLLDPIRARRQVGENPIAFRSRSRSSAGGRFDPGLPASEPTDFAAAFRPRIADQLDASGFRSQGPQRPMLSLPPPEPAPRMFDNLQDVPAPFDPSMPPGLSRDQFNRDTGAIQDEPPSPFTTAPLNGGSQQVKDDIERRYGAKRPGTLSFRPRPRTFAQSSGLPY